MSSRISCTQIFEFVDELANYGYPRSIIRTKTTEKFGITHRQTDRYYQLSQRRLKQRFEMDYEKNYQFIKEKYQELLIRAHESGDLSLERQVLKDIKELYQLGDIPSNNTSVNVNILNNMKDLFS